MANVGNFGRVVRGPADVVSKYPFSPKDLCFYNSGNEFKMKHEALIENIIMNEIKLGERRQRDDS